MKPAGPVFDRLWRLRSVVELVSRNEADWMVRRHYLGKWPGVVMLTLGLRIDSVLLGVVIYALPPRETHKRYGGETWELARLWLDDSLPQNAETFLISKSVKYIKRLPKFPHALVSYADPSVGHSGTIYVAAGWVRDGSTDDERKSPRCDYVCEETGKKYSRRKHIPEKTKFRRVPRVSKPRFVKKLGRWEYDL